MVSILGSVIIYLITFYERNSWERRVDQFFSSTEEREEKPNYPFLWQGNYLIQPKIKILT